MDAATRVAKNTGLLYGRILINLFISLYSTRLILNALGVEDFGIYNLVGGTIAMLTFLNSAMAEATQRFMSYAHGENDINKQIKIFNVSVVIHLLISVFVILILEVVGYFLFKNVLKIPQERVYVAKLVYQFMVASTFFTIIKVPYDSVLLARENMLFVALIGTLHSFVKLGIAFFITYTTFDRLTAYGFLMALLSILIIIVSYFYCYTKYEEVRFDLIKQFDKKLFKEMGSFASWTLLIHSTAIVTMQGTSIVLNTFFGVIVNAAQGVSNQVSNQLKQFAKTMQKALNPVIVKKEGEKNRGKMLEAAMFGNKILFFILSFLSVPIFIEMPFIFNLWLKDVPEFAVIFCRLHLLRLVIGSTTQTFYVAIGAIGKIKQDSIWESLIFVSVLPLSFLMYKFGASPEAIYINLIIMDVGIAIIRVYFLNRLGGLSVKTFLKNIIARCLGVYVIVISISSIPLLIFKDSFIRMLIVFFLSSILFLITIYLWGINKNERNQIKEVLNNIFNRTQKVLRFTIKGK